MATALVDALSPTNGSRAGQERQFSRHEDGLQREVGHAEALQATEEMCAYCFGACLGVAFRWIQVLVEG